MALSHYQEAGVYFKQSQSLTKRTRVKFVLLEATAFVKAGKLTEFILAPGTIATFCKLMFRRIRRLMTPLTILIILIRKAIGRFTTGQQSAEQP